MTSSEINIHSWSQNRLPRLANERVIFKNLQAGGVETSERKLKTQEGRRGSIDSAYARKHQELLRKNDAILTARGRDQGRKVIGRLKTEFLHPVRSFRNGLITGARRVEETQQRGLDAVDNELKMIALRKGRNEQALAKLQKMTKKRHFIQHARIGVQRGVSKIHLSPDKLVLKAERKLRQFSQGITEFILKGVEGNMENRYARETAMLGEIEESNTILAQYYAEAVQEITPDESSLPTWTIEQRGVLERFIGDPTYVNQEWLQTRMALNNEQEEEFLGLLRHALGRDFSTVEKLEARIKEQLQSKGMHNYFEERDRQEAVKLVAKGKKLYHETLGIKTTSQPANGDSAENILNNIASQSPDIAYTICGSVLDSNDQKTKCESKLKALLLHPSGVENREFLDQIDDRIWRSRRHPTAISAQDLIHVQWAAQSAPAELKKRVMEELGNTPEDKIGKFRLGTDFNLNEDFSQVSRSGDELSVAYEVLMTEKVRERLDAAKKPVPWERKLVAARYIAQKLKQTSQSPQP